MTKSITEFRADEEIPIGKEKPIVQDIKLIFPGVYRVTLKGYDTPVHISRCHLFEVVQA